MAKVLRRCFWVLVFVAGVGVVQIPGVQAENAPPRVVKETLKGRDAQRFIQERLRTSPGMLREQQRIDSKHKYQPTEHAVVTHWSVAKAKPQGWLASALSAISGTTVEASSCPWEVRQLLERQRPTVQRADLKQNDPCDDVEEIYGYYDVYESSHDSNAVSADVAVEITGNVYTFQRIVADITATLTEDSNGDWWLDGDLAVDVVEDYSDSDSGSSAQFHGIDCSDKVAIRDYLAQHIAGAVIGWLGFSAGMVGTCAHLIELSGSWSLRAFLGCVGVSSGIAGAIANGYIAVQLGSYWWDCIHVASPIASAHPSRQSIPYVPLPPAATWVGER